MMDPQRLEKLDLSDRQSFNEVKAAVDEVVFYQEHVKAFDFLRSLEQRLRFLSEAQLGELAEEYESLIVKLRWVAFSDLTERDAINLVREHLVDFFSTELNLDDTVKQRIVMITLVERDDFKKKIRDAIIKNNQVLTKLSLTIGEGMQAQTPTIANWIRDYTYNVGSDLATPSAVAKYFSQSSNIVSLDEKDREKVLKLLRYYEQLKFPSNVVEGFDSPAVLEIRDKLYIAVDGQVIAVGDPRELQWKAYRSSAVGSVNKTSRADVKAKKFQSLEDRIRSLNTEHANEDEKRFLEEEELLDRVNAEMFNILSVITSALVINDHEKVITGVSILARSGAIDQALKEKALRDPFLEEFLKPLAEAQQVDIKKIVGYLERNPSDLIFSTAFIQWALTRSFHGDKSESARIGNRLENTLSALGQTEVVGMTYFDVSQGAFRWTPFKVNSDGSLSWVE